MAPNKQLRRHSSTAVSTFDANVQNLIQKWKTLSDELNSFEEKHRIYLSKLEEIEKLKKDHRAEFDKVQRKVTNLNKIIDSHQSFAILSNGEQTSKVINKTDVPRSSSGKWKKSRNIRRS